MTLQAMTHRVWEHLLTPGQPMVQETIRPFSAQVLSMKMLPILIMALLIKFKSQVN